MTKLTKWYDKHTYLSIVLPAFLFLSLIGIAYSFILPKIKTTIIASHQAAIEDMLLNTHNYLLGYYELEQKGMLTRSEAQQLSFSTLSDLSTKDDRDTYIWITEKSGLLISPNINGDIEQKNENTFSDAPKNGIKNKESAFVENIKHYQMIDFEPWNWEIRGTYNSSLIKVKLQEFKMGFIIISAIVTLFMVAILFLIILTSFKHINKLTMEEAELTYSNLRFKEITDNTVNGLAIYENDKLVFMNNQLYLLLGYKPNDEIDVDYMNYVIDEEKELVRKHINNFRNGKGRINEFSVWINDNQGKRKCLLNKLVYEKKDEKTTMIYVISTDITDKKLAEHKLRQLYEIIAQVPASIILTDTEEKIEYVNPVFEKSTGYSFSDVYGQTPGVFKSGKMDESVYTDLKDSFARGEIWEGELLNKRKNGELIWESVISFPIKNEKNEIINFGAILHDISESRKIKDELIKAKENAEKGEKIKTAFLANVSHEVHTPLNAILGFTQLLKDKLTKDHTNYEYTQIIESNTETLLKLFSDILEYSLLESGNIEIDKSEIEINELLLKICSRYNSKLSTIQDKKLDLIFTPDNSGAVIIETDRGLLIKILDNLISNALKYTSSGYIKIGYHLQNKAIDLYIEDTGAGIADDEKDKIFNIFYHGEREFISQHKGTGLGLNIVKKTVELLGGELRFKSKLNEGTTFSFSIPQGGNISDNSENSNKFQAFLT